MKRALKRVEQIFKLYQYDQSSQNWELRNFFGATTESLKTLKYLPYYWMADKDPPQ